MNRHAFAFDLHGRGRLNARFVMKKESKPNKRPQNMPGVTPDNDPLQGPLQPTRVNDPRKGDDRNLVLTDDDFTGGDFEERMKLFWQRNQVLIIAVVVLAFVGAIGYQLVNQYRLSYEAKVQDAYRSANNQAALLAFAEAYPRNALAAIALLEVADEHYQSSDYAAAASLYGQVATLLAARQDPLTGRARVGQGIALLRGGEINAGQAALQTSLADTTLADPYRAEAAYHLAILSLKQGNPQAARDFLQEGAGLPNAGSWGQRAVLLVQTNPQLMEQVNGDPAELVSQDS